MLPPLGIIFGLFVSFTTAQVWSDGASASAAVDRATSALRSVVILAATSPGETELRLRALIGSYIAEAAAQEWPLMAHRAITLRIAPHALAEALQLNLGLEPRGPAQQTAQREITTALENAMDARRQRLTISQSQVDWVKAISALIAIAMVHSDNRLASAITMLLFATGVAASVLLIDRPFIGEILVGPDPLLQVMPGSESS